MGNSLSNRIEAILRNRPVIVQLLRFAAIGSINTALNFIILNFLTKQFPDNSSGGFEGLEGSLLRLGIFAAISFAIAIIQSYIWNRAWAFGESSGVSVFQNALRLMMVGGLGFLAFVAVFFGAAKEATGIYYLMVLLGFMIIQIILWFTFKLRFGQHQGAATQFATFLLISLVGLGINSTIVVIATKIITPGLEMYVNPDLIKNVAAVMATAFSLIWNFVGYKIFVFKR